MLTKKQTPCKRKRKEDEKEVELQECKDQLLRLRAEFENYKKHLDREYNEKVKNSNADLIKNLLPVLDTFEIAINEIKKKDTQTAEGIELIYREIFKILEKNGLKKIESIGKKFDPYYHEIVMQELSDKEDGTIIEEFQKGYMLNDKVIRHSKVKISKQLSGGAQNG